MNPSRRLVLQEPDEDTREALCALLEDSGYEVIATSTTEESLAVCSSEEIALVIADFPSENGSAELDAARDLTTTCGVPVGILTGARRMSAGDAARDGFAFLVWKPFDFEHLLSAVASAVGSTVEPGNSADVRVVHAYFERLSRRDWAGVASLCREDVVYRLPGVSRRAREVRGRDAFRAFTEETFRSFRDARFEDVRCVCTPERIVAGYVGSWTQLDGTEVNLPGYVVFTVRDGQITEIGVRLDEEQLERVDPGIYA